MGVNYLAVLAVSVIVFIIGALWYSPVLFGNLWIRLSKISTKDIAKAKQKSMIGPMLTTLISTVVTATVFEYLLDILNYTNIYDGIILSLLVWLGFIATSMLNGVLWENKPMGVYLLNIAHQFVSLAVMGAILSVW
ncbi:MAG: DUF1761 domain-containing protein [Nanoarchaeota archaeon]